MTMRRADRFVIVGASLAGLRAAEALRDDGFQGSVAIVGDEPHAPYNRPPLSKQLLTGKQTPSEIAFACDDTTGIDWHLGDAATGLDLAAREVRLARGAVLSYDRLLIATGVSPIIPKVPGVSLPGVHVLRTLDDAAGMKAALTPGARLVIIGAGFIGCETAASARALGVDVTVIDQAAAPMVRGVPPHVAAYFRDLHEANGVRFQFGRTMTGIDGTDRVTGVRLDDGTQVPADHVLIGVGGSPATGWLTGSGLDVANGVLCDRHSLAIGGGGLVAAAGDVARFPHAGYDDTVMRLEHWTNAAEQGAAAIRSLRDGPSQPYTPLPSFWSDQYEAKLQTIGLPGLADRFETVAGDLQSGKVLIEGHRGTDLVAAIALNMAPKLARYRRQMEQALRDRAAASV